MGKIPVHEASLQVEKLFDEFAKICELQNLSSNQSSLTFTEDEQCEKRSIHADLDGTAQKVIKVVHSDAPKAFGDFYPLPARPGPAEVVARSPGSPRRRKRLSEALSKDKHERKEALEDDDIESDAFPTQSAADEDNGAVGGNEPGPSEQQLHDAAMTIAKVGDEFDELYKSRMKAVELEVLDYIKHSSAIDYTGFMCVLNQHLPPDRSVTTLMMVMHLSKHVISKHWTMASTLLQFFREFFSQAFSETIADEGGVEDYVGKLKDSKPDL